jgi:hypothetical protein
MSSAISISPGLELGEQEIEHDETAGGSHVEPASARPVAELLHDGVVGSNLDGFVVGWCHR